MDRALASEYNTSMIQKKILAGYQRAWLRKSAHSLKPVVSIGHGGISDSVEKSIIEALVHHELIKVKFYDLKEERQEACDHISKASGALLIGIIGNIAIFYREAAKPEDRKYHIPVKKTLASGPANMDADK